MIQDTKEQKVKQQEPGKPENDGLEAQAYSQVFLSAMIDTAYNTLDDYLKTQRIDPEARELLTALVQLYSIREIYEKKPLVLYIWNKEASYSIGRISQVVPKLGGQFLSPTGYALE